MKPKKRTLFEILQAEEAGWRSRHEGHRLSDNPYGEDVLVIAWGNGWMRARSEQKRGIHAPDCPIVIDFEGLPCNCGAAPNASQSSGHNESAPESAS